jgi:phosphoribosylpyrophosphate synthetase
MSQITIDTEKFGIDKSTERNLNKTLDKMKGNEYFSISGFPTKFRGVFKDWLKVNDLVLSKIVDKNVCLIDDFVTTGSTMKEASKLLEEAGAKSVLGLCVLKGGH